MLNAQRIHCSLGNRNRLDVINCRSKDIAIRSLNEHPTSLTHSNRPRSCNHLGQTSILRRSQSDIQHTVRWCDAKRWLSNIDVGNCRKPKIIRQRTTNA